MHHAARRTNPPPATCSTSGRLVTAHVSNYADRPYLLATPAEGGRGRPLVIGLHGSGSGPAQLEAASHLAARGAAAGVSVVLPSADDHIWHNFSTFDQDYLDQVISAALRTTCGDAHALVLTGFSNGGDESQTMGCLEAARWRAVVVVSSSTVPDRCVQGGTPVTLLRVHGLLDRTSPFEGRGGIDPRDAVLPATQQWAAYDGCRARPVRDGVARRWLGCKAGTSVELLALPGIGHTWPTRPDVTGLVLALARGAKAPSGR